MGIFCLFWVACNRGTETRLPVNATADSLRQAPDTATIPHNEFGDMVRYGRELIVNTAYYMGPEGRVNQNLGNKMNCSNCHLDAGTRPFAFNFLSTHGRYPQYRARENRTLTLADRVNNCVERPHNGRALPLDSKEMVAMLSYMKWLAQGVPAGQRVKGGEGMELRLPDRPADPEKGKLVYAQHCSSCHGNEGQGLLRDDSVAYLYPPLWGKTSYERGSSMHRIVKAASFIKANMPFNIAKWNQPVLTDEEALDVAAFINDDRIHPRPRKEGGPNYPAIFNKPIDYDEGPFPDSFSVEQHKFGPYTPIVEHHKNNGLPINF